MAAIEYLVDEVSGRKYPASYTVNPFELDRQLSAWCELYRKNKAEGLERPKMNDYLGRAFEKIARGISSRHNFINYTFKDEMVSDAIIHVIQYVHSYKSDAATQSGYPPAYSYVYKMCWNCFANRIELEEEQQIMKYLAISKLGVSVDSLMVDEAFSDSSDDDRSSQSSLISDYMAKIHEYEAKIAMKKNRKKQNQVVEEESEGPMLPKDDSLFSFMESE